MHIYCVQETHIDIHIDNDIHTHIDMNRTINVDDFNVRENVEMNKNTSHQLSSKVNIFSLAILFLLMPCTFPFANICFPCVIILKW